MSPNWGRHLVALVGAGGALVLGDWLDTVVIAGIRRTSEQNFDISQLAWALPLGYLAIAAAVLVSWFLARWANSVLVGLVYVLVGAFLAFLLPLWWYWAAEINGAAPLLPGPIASFVNQVYGDAEQGPLNAVAIIGAGMLLVGLVSLGSALRHRRPVERDEADVPSESVASPG